MSRIGKLPINLPAGVIIKSYEDSILVINGPKGELTLNIDPVITINVNEAVITVERHTNQKKHKALHGLYRVLVNNMITGVTTGFTKSLELVGVGYKATFESNILDLDLGYSHKIYFTIPSEVGVRAEIAKNKNPIIHLSSIDKQLLGQVAAKIKSLRKVEPYKGKGIRYLGEQVRQKEGKRTSK
jgi:large subunit ribosomal protein L6